MSEGTWTVAEAKARLSELVEEARSKGPQTITRHGRTRGGSCLERGMGEEDETGRQSGGILCRLSTAGFKP
jgi:hypothetical protein